MTSASACVITRRGRRPDPGPPQGSPTCTYRSAALLLLRLCPTHKIPDPPRPSSHHSLPPTPFPPRTFPGRTRTSKNPVAHQPRSPSHPRESVIAPPAVALAPARICHRTIESPASHHPLSHSHQQDSGIAPSAAIALAPSSVPHRYRSRARAFLNTAAIIVFVSTPVFVFCRLGW